MKSIGSTGLAYLWGKIKSIIPTKVSDLTNDSGFTSNVGTITGITMNGASKGASGVVNLGTVITEHQDISGKADISDLAEVATSGDYDDLLNVPDVVIISNSESIEDLDIVDEQGNILARFMDGHFSVKNFSTADKVTSISSSSTDAQFPSAKCVYDLIGDVESLLAAI